MTGPVMNADNPGLSPTPRVETAAYGQFARRIVRAYSRRVADADLAEFAGLVRLRDDLDAVIAQAAVRLHDRCGYSWTEIGAALGISRQAARQRWGTP